MMVTMILDLCIHDIVVMISINDSMMFTYTCKAFLFLVSTAALIYWRTCSVALFHTAILMRTIGCHTMSTTAGYFPAFFELARRYLLVLETS